LLIDRLLTPRILRRLCADLKVSDDIDFRALAKLTPGYVAADLNALTAEAGVIAIRRFFEDMMAQRPPQPVVDGIEQMAIDDTNTGYVPASDIRDAPLSRFILAFPPPLQADQLGSLPLRATDFESALKTVQPSAKREGFATIPDVTWSDVGALMPIRDELHYAIVEPIRRPERFMKFGIDAPSGVLLWGPPGCGKTLLAKAVANESRANFISVKGPELLNKVSYAQESLAGN
jgi:ribosome biogenesis ATPase